MARTTRRRQGLARIAAAATASAAALIATAALANTVQPRPAQIMPEATNDILIDLARTPDHFVAVGARGHILRSVDGVRWDQVASPVRAMLTRVAFVDDTTGWAVGHDATILHSTDGGASWQLRHFKPEWYQALYDIHFVDADTGFAVGAYDLFLETTDGGQTWTRKDTLIGEGGLHYYSVTPLNDGTLLIAGERGMLARSMDDGQTWERVVSPYFGSFFGAVPAGETGAVVIGLRGNAYYLPDISALETTQPDDYGEYPLGEVPEDLVVTLDTDTVDSLFNGIAADDGSALIVGVNGIILRFDPNTTTLTRIDNPRNSTLGDIAVRDGGYVLVGEAGVGSLDAQ